MIVPDVNLLIYAYNSDAPFHLPAKAWWEEQLSKTTIGMPWASALGFIRIMTHPKVMERPLKPAEATNVVREWIKLPQVQLVVPGPRHLDLLSSLLIQAGQAGNLTTDAHLAAIAIEYRAQLHSNDQDFGRFSGLQWINPIAA